MSFYFFAWVSSIAFAGSTITAKLSTKYGIKNPWLLNFFWSLFVLILMTPFAFYFDTGAPPDWPNILFASFFFALASVVYTFALYRLDVSVISPMYNIRTAMATLLGVFLLGEILSTQQIFLIIAIFIFGLFLSLDEKFSLKSFWSLGVLFAILSMLFYTIESFFINKALLHSGFWQTSFYILLFGQIWLLFTVPFFKKEIKLITARQYISLIPIAIFSTIGTLAIYRAYAENVSISAAISSLPVSMVLAFILSIFAPELLERHTLKVYAVGFISAGAMIIAALYL